MKIYTTATLFALCCSVLGPLSASEESNHKPTFRVKSRIVTGQSPFPCPPTAPALHPWPNTQVETSLSVGYNPIDSRFPMVVIAYQEDRYNQGGGANANYMIISLDGGKTFGAPIPIPTVTCFGGPYERDTNPNVRISSTGDIFVSTLPYNVITNGLDNVAVAKYDVRKKKFLYLQYLDPTDGGVPPFILTDFDGLTVDPQDESGKTAYVTWDIEFFPTGDFTKGQVFIRFSKTTDGVHFSKPSILYQLPQSVVDQFGGDVGAGLGSIAFLNNPGKPFSKLLTIFGVFVNLDLQPPPFNQSSFPYSTVSTDQGETWSNPIPLNNTNDVVFGQVVDPANFDRLIRTAAGGGAVVDRDRNIIYVINAEHSLVYDGIPTQLVLYVSLDEAASWIKIGPVNTVLKTQAFSSSACLLDEGRIAISYYDFRNYTGDPNGSLQSDRWLDIYNFNKETKTLTLEKELRLTKESFNRRNAPQVGFGTVVTPGLFLGDYFGMEFFERKIYHAFAVVPHHQGPNQSHLQFSVIEQIHPIPGNQ